MSNSIKKYPIPLILKKILEDKISGELIIKGEDFKKTLFFKNGNLLTANTDLAEERLGEILFESGKIDQDQRQIINNSELLKKEKIGKILIQENILNKEEVFTALQLQTKIIALSTFSLEEGEWKFIIKTPKLPSLPRFRTSMEEILIEGIDKMKDISHFKKEFSKQTLIIRNIPQSTSKFLSIEEINFYMELTNFSYESCHKISSALKKPELFFWKKIILFYLLNMIDFTEFIISRDDSIDYKSITGEVDELYKNLKVNRLDYYELLGVGKKASLKEIQDAYSKLSKKYLPDRIKGAVDSKKQEKINFVFKEIKEAFETLSQEDKKEEYDSGGFQKKEEEEVVSKGDLIKKAKANYLKASLFYKEEKYQEAVDLLKNAVKFDQNKSKYLLLLGLSQSKIPSQRKEAEKNLKRASELEPWNAEPVFALGVMYRKSSAMEKAEACFKKALEINMDYRPATRMMEEIKKRSQHKKTRFSLFKKKGD
jgi:curved DNA-binding protein CbpA